MNIKNEITQIDLINNKFILPAYEKQPARYLDLESWLIFFGVWIAEGSSYKNYIAITAYKHRVKNAINIVNKKL